MKTWQEIKLEEQYFKGRLSGALRAGAQETFAWVIDIKNELDRLKQFKPCLDCDGTGQYNFDHDIDRGIECPTCHGTGVKQTYQGKEET
jgi:hypothetical protein